MDFDSEGHIRINPAEFQALLLESPVRLINDVLLHGTPAVFASFTSYRDFVDFLSHELFIHPSSIVFRGSTKIGFSIAPRPEKIWRAMGPDSDIDLAIVDPDQYHLLDSEIRRYERNLQRFKDPEYHKSRKRRESRSFYCYRHMDLPPTPAVAHYFSTIDIASSTIPPGCGRFVTAFFFRDWWSLYSRYEFDLRRLCQGFDEDLPHGPNTPLSRDG